MSLARAARSRRLFIGGISIIIILCRLGMIGKRVHDCSPTCCTRHETRKWPFTWATWLRAAVSRFHNVATLFRVDTVGHCSLRVCRRMHVV